MTWPEKCGDPAHDCAGMFTLPIHFFSRYGLVCSGGAQFFENFGDWRQCYLAEIVKCFVEVREHASRSFVCDLDSSFEDSLRYVVRLYSRSWLSTYVDPVFGMTVAAVLFQFLLEVAKPACHKVDILRHLKWKQHERWVILSHNCSWTLLEQEINRATEHFVAKLNWYSNEFLF